MTWALWRFSDSPVAQFTQKALMTQDTSVMTPGSSETGVGVLHDKSIKEVVKSSPEGSLSLPADPKKRAAFVELLKREHARRHVLPFSRKLDSTWLNNWHLDLLAGALERIEAGSLKRLMVFMPPRHGKSQLSSINFPAWYLGRNPQKEIVVASYTAELAIEFGRKTRDLLDNENYKNIFKTRLNEGSQSAQRWNTREGGGYFAVGVGGSLTGRGADLLVIDDILSGREDAESVTQRERVWQWYNSTAYTRLSPTGAVIIVLTRWHDDDLAGRLLKQQPDTWEVLSLPAIAEEDEEKRARGEPLWPVRFPLSQLEEIKRTIGTYEWSSLYQQNPLDEGSQEFKRQYFKLAMVSEVLKKNTKNFLTIDPAVSKKDSADFTGFCLNFVDEKNFWYFKAWREKLSPGELIDKLFLLSEKYKLVQIGIEKGMYSLVVKPFLDQEMRVRQRFLRIQELKHNQTQKEIRIRALLPRYEAGSIYHLEGECGQLEEELLRFPKAKHDDVSDAAAYMCQLCPVGGTVEFAGADTKPNFRISSELGEERAPGKLNKFDYSEDNFEI